MTNRTKIKGLHGRRIWDSRGLPTVEAEIILQNGSIGRGVAPAGRSRGSREAIELRDGGSRLAGMDVSMAINNINQIMAPALIGMDSLEQKAIDDKLLEIDPTSTKQYLGGNSAIAVSFANLSAAASSENQPLWRYIAGNSPVSLPLPEIQIFGGGVHADRRVDIQDFMVIPLSPSTFNEAIEMVAEVYISAGHLMSESGRISGISDEGGWWPDFNTNEEALETLVRSIELAGFIPGEDLGISLDVAASHLTANGNYQMGLEQLVLSTDELIELLGKWINSYPIVSIEDPLDEDDKKGMKAFTDAYGSQIQIIGDDYLTTNAEKIRESQTKGICNAVLIKPNQVGTISETIEAMAAAQGGGWGTILSARSGETEDVTICHLAVGWNVGQIKVGSFARSERMAKWNECLRIAEQLGDRCKYAGRAALNHIKPPIAD